MNAFGQMKRFLVAVLVLACAAPTMAEAPAKPNIILIMADDLGRECLGVYGSAEYPTPRLDKFAAESVRFTHCHALPLCTPSRVQLMTGKYNSRNYISFGALKPGEKTFGHYLKEAGYATGVVGKWQLDGGRYSDDKGMTPEEAGFDDYCLWHYLKRGSRYADPLLKPRDKDLTEYKGLYGPDLQDKYALHFIEEHKAGPFFLYYPMTLVHDPFEPTPDTDEWKEGNHAKANKNFKPMVEYMDKLVGGVIDKVRALGIEDNTIIFFTGDNGTNRDITSRMADGSMIRGGKGLTIDTGTHVPLIVHWPGHTAPGSTYDGLIGFEDFLPTLLEVAGVARPADAVIDGESFLPQIEGKAGERRPWQYAYYNPMHGDRERARYVRTLEYKLYDDGRFFKTASDLLEESPLDPAKLDDATRALRDQLQGVLDANP